MKVNLLSQMARQSCSDISTPTGRKIRKKLSEVGITQSKNKSYVIGPGTRRLIRL
jgi:hypothetical protein